MSGFWKIVIIIAIVLVAMAAITFFVPEVKEFAKETAGNSKLPLWIVGLFAPILFFFNAIGRWLKGLIGQGSTEKDIAKENEAIKAEREKLLEEVRRLDEWRTRELALQRAEIAVFENKIVELRKEAARIDLQFAQIMAQSPESFTEKMSREELQEQLARIGQDLGVSISSGRVIP
jgi:CBS domain containing-hemolysin-like protein